jgi:YNFM family putative membrane transporter
MSLQRGTPAFRAFCATLFAAGFSMFSLLYSAQALLPAFVEQFHVSPAQSSLAVSCATAAVAVSIFLSASISDAAGRRAMIVGALFGSALLTLVSALLESWHLLLLCRALMGLTLGGMPSVLIAYMSEEVHVDSVGLSTGLYVSGSVCGGMFGRLVAGLLADAYDWRVALAVLGVISLLGAVYSWRALPPSRNFKSQRAAGQERLRRYLRPLQDEGLPWIIVNSFLLMGGFITVYNYVGFRLQRAPYYLGQSAVAWIFSLYLVGMLSSAWAGSLAGRYGRRRLYWPAVVLALAGVILTLAAPLGWVVAGLGLLTFGYFGAHSLASSWVGLRGGECRAQAASLYLCSMYAGSSIAGWAGGFVFSARAWPGVAGMVIVMLCLALAIALRLTRISPLPRAPAAIDPVAASN